MDDYSDDENEHFSGDEFEENENFSEEEIPNLVEPEPLKPHAQHKKVAKGDAYDDANYLKDALEQIKKLEQEDNKSKMNKKTAGLEVTTEGISQDDCKNINLAKITDLLQCHWCAKYHNNEIILKKKDYNVCKHCYFSVNHDEANRLKFDTECADEGTGIALYIIECKDSHNTEKCTRKADCYLCDFKLGKPINNILNVSMLGIEERSSPVIFQDSKKKLSVPSAEFIEKHENVMFCGGLGEEIRFKIPKKLSI